MVATKSGWTLGQAHTGVVTHLLQFQAALTTLYYIINTTNLFIYFLSPGQEKAPVGCYLMSICYPCPPPEYQGQR